jgi:hypothetical protein
MASPVPMVVCHSRLSGIFLLKKDAGQAGMTKLKPRIVNDF